MNGFVRGLREVCAKYARGVQEVCERCVDPGPPEEQQRPRRGVCCVSSGVGVGMGMVCVGHW